MTTQPRVLLVDDHALFRRGMTLLLRDLLPQLVITEAASCTEAVGKDDESFDVVLMDWHMPGMDGFDALAAIKNAFPMSALVVLSSEENSGLIRQILEAGAVGFIPKSSEPRLMLGALQLVLSNGIYLPPQVLNVPNKARPITDSASGQSAVPASLKAQLTPRQIQMLELALKGVSNKLIARQFDISDGTVKSHLSTVYRVMNVANRTEALYELARFNH